MDDKAPILNELDTSVTEEAESISGTAHGLTVFTCALFIYAEMAGSGILALPRAIVDSGWTGLALLIACCFFSMYCGIILGKCWILILQRNPALSKNQIRDPYPLIGSVAAGKVGKIVVEICILVTLFGVCTVFLLLSSDLISNIANVKFVQQSSLEFRIWVLICGALLLPFTWLATPKDLWPFAIGAAICTTIACLLVFVRCGMELHRHGVASDHGHVSAKSFFHAFGTIAFAFGGATLFPSLQADMAQPQKFSSAAALGFIYVLLLYVPITLIPYLTFGSGVDGNLLNSLNNLAGSGRALVVAAQVLIAFHLLFAFVITLNPISQQVEEYLRFPHKFGWRRVILRTLLLISVLGLAELLPHFEFILGLIGATTVTMMGFILPCLFYLLLVKCPLWVHVLHIEIIIVAVMMGIASTYSAISEFQNPF